MQNRRGYWCTREGDIAVTAGIAKEVIDRRVAALLLGQVEDPIDRLNDSGIVRGHFAGRFVVERTAKQEAEACGAKGAPVPPQVSDLFAARSYGT